MQIPLYAVDTYSHLPIHIKINVEFSYKTSVYKADVLYYNIISKFSKQTNCGGY